jgi:uncharacterized membrane protein YhaH (DUF805 family)
MDLLREENGQATFLPASIADLIHKFSSSTQWIRSARTSKMSLLSSSEKDLMDIVSHGLWGSIAFGRKNRSSFWMAFVIGMAPDIFSFGILWAAAMLGLSEQPDFSHGTPPESTIPQYVHHLYNVTHSFIIFLAVFFLVWFLLKRPLWELGAWGLHVLVDIPTHSYAFFPTPVFWPLSDWKFNGWQWMTPSILIPNFVLLSLLYAWYFWQAYRTKGR